MVTCIIDAMEGHNVAVSDITGAFLQTDMVHRDHTVRARLCGVLVDLLVKIDPSKFLDKVFLGSGQKVIYSFPKNSL